jgi:hypothetical protein
MPTTDPQLFIRVENFMGDTDDHAELLLLGPFPTAADRLAEWRRLSTLPLGDDAFHGGILLHSHAVTGPVRADRVVAPDVVAEAPTIRDFFDRFFGFDSTGTRR